MATLNALTTRRKLDFIQRQCDKVFTDIKSGRYEKFCSQNQNNYAYREIQNVHFPSLMQELVELAREYATNIDTTMMRLPDIITDKGFIVSLKMMSQS